MVRERPIDLRRMTQKDLAEVHGVDPRSVRRWIGLGMPRNTDGTFDAAATVLWRCKVCDRHGLVTDGWRW